jgi:hypothetical protein
MNLPFDPQRFPAYETEFGLARIGWDASSLLDDSSLLFVHETHLTPEIESLMATLGSPTKGKGRT